MNIKEYLKNILGLEKDLYTLNQSIYYLTSSQKNLGISYSYKQPTLPVERTGIAFLSGFYLGIIAGITIGLIYGLYELFHGGTFWGNFLSCAFICGACCGVFGIWMGKYSYKSLYTEYKEKMNDYHELIKKDKIRVDQELKKKRNIDLQINVLQKNKDEISSMLRKLYDMNIIYPKYHNFIAVATFYEYFDSGRCNSLEGHEGAYNIFETELRLDKILGKLDDIINHLEKIRSTQYAIYNAISEGNRTANAIYQTSQKISDNMTTLADNTAITAYNSEIATRNTEILKFISIYDHIK